MESWSKVEKWLIINYKMIRKSPRNKFETLSDTLILDLHAVWKPFNTIGLSFIEAFPFRTFGGSFFLEIGMMLFCYNGS